MLIHRYGDCPLAGGPDGSDFILACTPDSLTTCLTPLEITCHHSAGTCSAPPLGKKWVS